MVAEQGLRLRHLAMHVATDDERDGLADRPAFPEPVQTGQVSGIERQLDRRPMSDGSTA
jgi:hypothetical protein